MKNIAPLSYTIHDESKEFTMLRYFSPNESQFDAS